MQEHRSNREAGLAAMLNKPNLTDQEKEKILEQLRIERELLDGNDDIR